MVTMEQLLFELQRRVILFKPGTVMPDGSFLSYDGDPNLVNQSGTNGEKLIYFCPQGTRYQQSDGTQWVKKQEQNTWEKLGAGTTFDVAFPTEETVGGIKPGRVFSNQPLADVLSDIFYPDPTLTDPDHSIVHDVEALQVAGATIPTINITLSFDRGSIQPAYTTDGGRAGNPTTFTFFRNTVQTDIPADGELEKTLVANSVLVALGTNKWEGRVSYLQGPQPVTVTGSSYDSPFPAGTTTLKEASFTGVYPIFATTDSISVLTQLPLQLMDDYYIEIHLAAETPVYRQTVWIPQAWSAIIGVRQATVFGEWDWLGGSKEASLTYFTITSESKIVEGNSIPYYKYVYNGAVIGSRVLRFWTVEPPIVENPEDPGNPVTYSESITHAIIF